MQRRDALLVCVCRIELGAVEQLLDGAYFPQARQLHHVLLDREAGRLVRPVRHVVELMLPAAVVAGGCCGHVRGRLRRGRGCRSATGEVRALEAVGRSCAALYCAMCMARLSYTRLTRPVRHASRAAQSPQVGSRAAVRSRRAPMPSLDPCSAASAFPHLSRGRASVGTRLLAFNTSLDHVLQLPTKRPCVAATHQTKRSESPGRLTCPEFALAVAAPSKSSRLPPSLLIALIHVSLFYLNAIPHLDLKPTSH